MSMCSTELRWGGQYDSWKQQTKSDSTMWWTCCCCFFCSDFESYTACEQRPLVTMKTALQLLESGRALFLCSKCVGYCFDINRLIVVTLLLCFRSSFHFVAIVYYFSVSALLLDISFGSSWFFLCWLFCFGYLDILLKS